MRDHDTFYPIKSYGETMCFMNKHGMVRSRQGTLLMPHMPERGLVAAYVVTVDKLSFHVSIRAEWSKLFRKDPPSYIAGKAWYKAVCNLARKERKQPSKKFAVMYKDDQNDDS